MVMLFLLKPLLEGSVDYRSQRDNDPISSFQKYFFIWDEFMGFIYKITNNVNRKEDDEWMKEK